MQFDDVSRLFDRTYEYYQEVPVGDDQTPDFSFKCFTLANYITVDEILERKYSITENQLKRILYKKHYDIYQQKIDDRKKK